VSFTWNPNITEVLISAVLSLVGWSVKRALTRLDEQSRRIAEIELSLARDYVKHDHLGDLKREQRRIGRMLAYIQLQLVALAARLNVRVEPFGADAEEDINVAA
jgi:methyl-accepting chemotaxis protein